MKHKINDVVIISILILLSGCAQLKETGKKIWGSSTETLENLRIEAISKIYFKASFDDCYEAVLSLDRKSPKRVPLTSKFFDVFLKDRIKGHIVVMGIKGNVDTTEVGIFFSKLSQNTVKIEITSLSSSAKKRVADAVFKELDLRFSSK